jgi:type VI secretion system protein ImpL
MKKPPVWLVAVWCACAACGVAIIVVGGLVKFPTLLQWLPGGLLIAGDAVWITLRFALGRPRKKSADFFSGNQTVFARVSRETNEAVSRYLGAVTRKGIMRKSALYERPWFLLCGAEKAGKTSLLKGAGLNFPLRYPSEKDGLVLDGPAQVTWHFANEAVWMDTPGALMSDDGKDAWQAFVASLSHVRPERPVDGVALVVSAKEVLDADDRAMKDIASTLRRRIDELIAAWGIEFPVYLLFNHSDKIPGFGEYFGDQIERAREQIFGATLSADLDKMLPRMAFAQEFSLLSRSLTDLRVDKLYKEKDEARRRMICRFVIHFEGIQEKLGAFVTELFKPSSYEGKPLFRGFYFTSCIEAASREIRDEPVAGTSAGQTIVNHPLNPRRIFASETPQRQKAEKKSEVKSLFVLPLFREIMVRGKDLVTATQKRTRREYVRHYAITAGIAAAGCVVAALMASGLGTSRDLLESVRVDLAAAPASTGTDLPAQYGSLDAMGKAVARLQGYEDRGAPPFARLFGFYRGRDALAGLTAAYFARINDLVVVPAVKYLEYRLWEKVQGYGELSGEDYDNLYATLKAYLSMSEAMSGRSKDIDTVFLRGVLLDAVKQSFLSTQNAQARLPAQVESILNENMGTYLLYLKRQAITPIQGNQRLVSLARAKLRRLPSAQVLYESVINRLSQDAPSISLDQMLGRKEEGILTAGRAISVLYTQDGWEKFVSDAIGKAASDPFKLDWVIGLSADQVPGEALDKKKLSADMTAAYLADFTSQWLGFLSSVKMEPFGDLARAQRILVKLTADKSELAVLLSTVADYTVLKKESMADAAGGAALAAASKIKGAQAAAAAAEKARNAADKAEGALALALGQKSPFDDLNAAFDPLRSFARSTGGALAGYEGYRDKIQTLASKIAALETQGEDNAPAVFTGKDDDPLLDCWKFSQSALANMPENLAASLKGVLMQPVDYAAAAAAAALTRTLTARWHSEIVKPFTAKFSGKYPFTARGDDAPFSDVMDFFRPQTGAFWGFYDRNLTPYLVKTASGWMVRPVGSLSLAFNSQLAPSLMSAERVRDIFFKPDGTVRPMSITLTPGASNKNSAKIEVGGQSFDLAPGGRPVTVSWPLDAAQSGAALKVNVSSDFTQDISFGGTWGFLRLMKAARVNKLNASTFNARWQVNVQNMYVIVLDCRVQVSGADNPFADPVFSGFDCPEDLFSAEVKK